MFICDFQFLILQETAARPESNQNEIRDRDLEEKVLLNDFRLYFSDILFYYLYLVIDDLIFNLTFCRTN